MSSFKQIVKNYKQVYKLGNQIIQHKHHIKQIPVGKLDEEFKKQEERIEKFIKITENADSQWNKHQHTINTYWTGLS